MTIPKSNGAVDAELFAALGTPRSAVEDKSGKVGTIVIALAALAVGAITFSSLAAKRTDPATRAVKQTAAALAATHQNVPAVQVGAIQTYVPPPVAEQESAEVAQAESVALPHASLDAPGLIFDFAGAEAASGAIAPANVGPSVVPVSRNDNDVPSGKQSTPNEKFVARMSDVTLVSTAAARMYDTSLIVTQGTIIPAILETAINSDLPGYARAVVSRDVRGFDGTRVLIPRGSKLIGEYKSGTSAGQSRAFVIWSRLITPEGVSVELASPAVDEVGKTGTKGETNSHFLTRFGSSILLSVIDAVLNIGVAKALSSNNSVVIATPQQATSAATVALQRNIDLPITISVFQGTPIRAFITQDLDFSGTASGQP